MSHILRKLFSCIFYSLLAAHLLAGAAVSMQLHDSFADLLQKHVTNGTVDYLGFKNDEKLLDAYLERLAAVSLATLSPDEKLALYINAYNSYTIKLILDNFDENGRPVSSIKKIGTLFTSPWDIEFATIDGSVYSLDDIEHNIIRKEWDEPRIHFAVNCASKSCPPLIATPYLGSSIDTQLDKVTRAFLADETMNYLEGNTLYVSSIFKWYGKDFKNGIVPFFLDHTEGTLHQRIKELGDSIKLKYLKYDWSLNSQ